MIDFRYHLVSLISVFLALAVGIVLGAGPLKEAIGDTLTGEVDDLRSSAAQLRTDLNRSQTELSHSEDAFATVAPDLLAGVLPGRRVAIVQLGSPDGGVAKDVADRFAQAGATVSATVNLTDQWTDTSRRTYRQTLAASVAEYLDPAPEVSAGTPEQLAEALVQALSNPDPADPDALSQDATVVLQLLVEGGLVELAGDVTQPADAVVVLVGSDADTPEKDPDAESTPDPSDEELALLKDAQSTVVEVALAAQRRAEGVVVAGFGLADEGVLRRLRSDDATASAVSTVAYVQSVVGATSVPLAMAERISGEVGHYGPDDGATAPVPPRVALAAPDRTPSTPVDGDATPDGTQPTPGDGSNGQG